MALTPLTSGHDPFNLSFDVGFNEGLEEAHARSVSDVPAPSDPDDIYIFHDPRVRRVMTYAVLAIVGLAVVVGAAMLVEWFQVGRHQVSTGVTSDAVLTEPLAVEPANGSIGGGLVNMAVGFLVAVALAGFLGMQVVRPRRN